VIAPLGDRVRQLRKACGWSARELSERAGGAVTRCVLADLENGRRQDLSLTSALAVAAAFGMSVEQLADTSTSPKALEVAAELAEAKQQLSDAVQRVDAVVRRL
jgi:transcriptional regulator with XRE-family HTH domain